MKQRATEIHQSLYRLFFEDADDGMMVWRAGGIIECNRSACRLFGRTRDEVLGADPWDFAPDVQPGGANSKETMSERIARVLAGERLRVESVYQRPGGELFTIEITLTPVSRKGEVSVLAAFRDVGARVRTEASLRESEMRFRNLTNHLPGVVYVCDNDDARTMSYVTEAINDLTGYRGHEFISKEVTFAELCHPEDIGEMRSTIESSLTRREPFELVYRLRHKRGEWHWSHEVGVGIFTGDELLHLEGFIHDITAIKETEARLAQSEAFHRAIVEDQTEFIVRWLPDGIRTFVNDAYCRYFGLTREEAIGTSFFPLIAETDRETVRSRIRLLTPESSENKDAHQVIRPDGTPGWQEWTDRAFFDEEGAVVEYQSTGRDITEQRHAQREALEAAELFRAAIVQSPAGILVADAPDVRIRHVNPAALEIRGDTAAELEGSPVEDHVASWQVFNPDRTPCEPENFPLSRAVLNGATTRGRELIIRRDDGEDRWVHVNAAPVRDAEGEIVAGIMVFSDITKRKQVEEAARQSRFSLDNSPEAVFWANADGRFTYVNDAACANLGYSREELLNMRVTDISTERTPENWPVFWESLRAKRSVQLESQHQHKDGLLVPVDLTVAFAVFEGREYAFAVARDITARKQAETELLQSREQLRALAMQLSAVEERERRTIATYLHDQIGQTLAVLKMRVGGLAEAIESESHLRVVRDIRELLDQAIDDTRTLTFDLSPPILYELGLGAAIEWVTENTCRRHELEAIFDEEGGDIRLDEDSAVQLFRGARELLMNVVKHARATKVTVKVSRSDSKVCVLVEDDGVGFDVDEVTGRPGARFGLMSIRERMRFIGGHLEVDSKPGRGTRSTLVVETLASTTQPKQEREREKK